MTKYYFLDSIILNTDDGDEKENVIVKSSNGKQWIVSFEKLSAIFPNLKQIHFINLYRFDNETLQRLIDWLKCAECKLEQIKFMYYDYEGSLDENPYFYDPDTLGKELLSQLKRLKWRMSYPKDRDHDQQKGFIIRLRK